MTVPVRAAPSRRPVSALGYLRRRRLVGAPLAAMAGRATAAEAPWPTRPVRLILPFGPGMVAEALMRGLAPHLSAAFGQPFLVENRPGAGGTIGTAEVARATDGHSLAVVPGGPTTTARALNPALSYDPGRDLRSISLLLRTPFVLTVAPGFPARDVEGFIAHARANPGRLAYGSIGPGTVSQLAMEEMKARHGLDLEHVAYRGFGQATAELIAGRIHAVLNPVGPVLPQLRAGALRGLMVSVEQRWPTLPEVPSLGETRFGVAPFFGWTGLVAPAGFPSSAADRLVAAMRAALNADAQLLGMLDGAGIEPVISGPETLERLQASESARWTAVIERLGLRATD